jgi:hypothetical protein
MAEDACLDARVTFIPVIMIKIMMKMRRTFEVHS